MSQAPGSADQHRRHATEHATLRAHSVPRAHARELVAIVIAALQRENPAAVRSAANGVTGTLPSCYSLDGDVLTFASTDPVSLAAPLGDGVASHHWALAVSAIERSAPACSPSDNESLLVALETEGNRFSVLDLSEIGCTLVVGHPNAVDGLIADLTDQVATTSCRSGVPGPVPVAYLGDMILDGAVAAEHAPDSNEAPHRLDLDLLGHSSLAASTTLLVASGPGAAEGLTRYLAADTSRRIAILTDVPTSSAQLIVVASSIGGTRVFAPLTGTETEHPCSGRQVGVLRDSSPVTPPLLADRVEEMPAEQVIPDVEIALLGPIEVSGTELPLGVHPKLSELVVYLAMHEEGALTRNWMAAVWPDRRVSPQTISNRLSEARRILGFASDGRPRLRRRGERYLLAEVTTDWARFQQLTAAGSGPDQWRAGLELVRGRPFDTIAQGQWTVFEGFAAEIEHAISDVALRFGAHALEAADPDLATWACQRALRACPFDERLHRLLMRAADAAGNRAGVESTLRQLALILEVDGDPLFGVHPQTAALYEHLARRDRAIG